MSSVVKRAARAILIDDGQRLLLIRRTKEGRPPYWTTPGGGVEADDVSVEAAMRRELREEIGADVSAVQQVFLVSDPAGDAGSRCSTSSSATSSGSTPQTEPDLNSLTSAEGRTTSTALPSARTARLASTCNQKPSRSSSRRTGTH